MLSQKKWSIWYRFFGVCWDFYCLLLLYMWSFLEWFICAKERIHFLLFTGWRLCPHLLENCVLIWLFKLAHANNILSPGCIASNRNLLISHYVSVLLIFFFVILFLGCILVVILLSAYEVHYLLYFLRLFV